jgi:hypothetical protein
MSLPAHLHDCLLEALQEAYPDPGKLDIFLQNNWGRDLNEFAANTLARPVRYKALIRQIDGESWIPKFVDVLRSKNLDNSRIQKCWQYFTANTGSSIGSAFDACLLMQSLPFWNRKKLRESLEKLVHSGGKRNLIVDGPEDSGRTFTRLFITHVATFHDITPYYVDLAKKASVPAVEITRLIARSFHWKLDDVPVKHAQATQWAEELGAWIVGNVRQEPKTVVLIFDNSMCAGLLQETRELVVYLAEQAVDVDRLRVALLAHKDILSDPAAHMLTEYEELQSPLKTEFRDFVDGYIRIKGYTKVTATQVSDVVDRVWAPLALAPPIRLDELAKGALIAMDAVDQIELL